MGEFFVPGDRNFERINSLPELGFPSSRPIFDRVRALNLPFGEYAVVGGAMEAHGIRPARDVDVVVTDELFTDLLHQGWPIRNRLVPRAHEETKMRLGTAAVQFHDELSLSGVIFATAAELIDQATIIEDIPFGPLRPLQAWKRARGREKDIEDVRLIEDYLAARTPDKAPPVSRPAYLGNMAQIN